MSRSRRKAKEEPQQPKSILAHSWGEELEKPTQSMIKSCEAFYKRYNLKFYSSLWVKNVKTNQKENIEVGSDIMVSGYSGFPGYYIAKVISFFDLSEKGLSSKRCAIEWYYLPDELRHTARDQLSIMRKNEVIRDLTHKRNVIEADTLLGNCNVTVLGPNQCFPEFDEEMTDCFYCHHGYDGKNIIRINNENEQKVEKPSVVAKKPKKKKLTRKIQSTSSALCDTPKKKKTVVKQKINEVQNGSTKNGNVSPMQSQRAPTVVKPVEKATPIKKFVPKMNASKALEVMMLDSTDEEDEELESDEDFVDFNQLKQQHLPKKKVKVTLEKLRVSPNGGVYDGGDVLCDRNGILKQIKSKPGSKTNKATNLKKYAPKPVLKEDISGRQQKGKMKSDTAENEKLIEQQMLDSTIETSPIKKIVTDKRVVRKSLRPNKKKQVNLDETNNTVHEFQTEKSTSVNSSKNNTDKLERTSTRKIRPSRKIKEESPVKAPSRRSLRTPKNKKKYLVESEDSGEETPEEEIYLDESSSSDNDLSEDESFEITKKKTGSKKNNRKYTAASTTNKKKCLPKKAQQKLARIPQRLQHLSSNKSKLEIARERLHVSSIPGCLPCRDDKFQSIFEFVHDRMVSGNGGCMFVSGVPGTGKTATVMEVVTTLQEMAEDDEIDQFNLVQVNGMKLTHPHQTYVEMLKQLNGTKTSPTNAADILTNIFEQRNKKTTLLIVDELDLLWTKKQDVLYHLFDWPTNSHAKLIVLSIANTMDLPERLMSQRVSSRLGMSRTAFLPYNFQQLEEIVNSRVEGLDIFAKNSVELAARKVATVSGDARRCLDICRRALDFIKENEKVKLTDIQKALKEMFASPIISFIRNCSRHEQAVLMALITQFRKSGLEEALVCDVKDSHSDISQYEGLPKISNSLFMQIVEKLKASRIISVDVTSSLRHNAKMRCNVATDDVIFACKA